MGKISVLPDEVVNQIAAGEVVERPSSVVKELVENALDAGATRIQVTTAGGGKQLIEVLDDGSGIPAADIELALTRHATSKLTEIDDLFCLDTLGFRGEALPSIASVSRMTVTTRTRDADSATRLMVVGGKVVESGEVGAPYGTRIEVRDLLFNVPARQKFLKGDAAESAQVTDAVTKLALAHSNVDFELRHGKRLSLRAAPTADGLARAQAVLGKRLGRELHPVEGSESGVTVTAYLAAPELAQTTSRGLTLFAGRRAVRDRGLMHAVGRGYGELIPRGRYPTAVLFVEVAGDRIDVNVHPQKQEVRFSDPQAVYAAVRHVVARGVARAPWLREAGPASWGGATSIAAAHAAEHRARWLWGNYKAPEPADGASGAVEGSAGGGADAGANVLPRPTAGSDAWARARARAEAGAEAGGEEGGDHVLPEPGFFSSLRFRGQLDCTYLLCEGEGELVLIDQHAAHERVVFERLKQRARKREVAAQPLLFPHTMVVDEAEAALVDEMAEELRQVGFELESFGTAGGRPTVAIKAAPSGLRDETETVARELLSELAECGGSRAVEKRLELALATVACHSSARAGDRLTAAEVEALLTELDATERRLHCPHGRPVLFRMGVAEIARKFGR